MDEGTLRDDSATGPEGADITLWLTRADQTELLRRQDVRLSFREEAEECPAITVDETLSYQAMEGFGFTLTGGSAWLIQNLDAETGEALLRELFSTEADGMGISYLRVSIGASDLSARAFTYDDLPPGQSDPALTRFDLRAGDRELIPTLQRILALNPDIKVMGSPWSAPPWMKTNRAFVGGRLKPECYGVYSAYFVKYLRAMEDCGIRLHAITPQNEPLNEKNEPSMAMAAEEQAEFIRNNLGPALRAAGLDTRIFCWDHNCDGEEDALRVLGDPAARRYLAGTAWHLYAGEVEALSRVHDAYPEKKIYFTEQWVGADGNFADDLIWHARNVLIGTIRNWSSVVLEWNLASDSRHGPHTPGGEPDCVGALTIGATITRNVAYYVIAHAAKFVPPDSVRIASNPLGPLKNVAFRTPDGRVVLIVLNDGGDVRRFDIRYRGKVAAHALEEYSLATYTWRA